MVVVRTFFFLFELRYLFLFHCWFFLKFNSASIFYWKYRKYRKTLQSWIDKWCFMFDGINWYWQCGCNGWIVSTRTLGESQQSGKFSSESHRNWRSTSFVARCTVRYFTGEGTALRLRRSEQFVAEIPSMAGLIETGIWNCIYLR